jgi:hypothetical protein
MGSIGVLRRFTLFNGLSRYVLSNSRDPAPPNASRPPRSTLFSAYRNRGKHRICVQERHHTHADAHAQKQAGKSMISEQSQLLDLDVSPIREAAGLVSRLVSRLTFLGFSVPRNGRQSTIFLSLLLLLLLFVAPRLTPTPTPTPERLSRTLDLQWRCHCRLR